MADPLARVADALRPVFVRLAADESADPVVRPSERADAQVNGSLALAKSLGRSPRDVAAMVLAEIDLSAMCSATEVAGPGFINLTFADGFLAAEDVADAALFLVSPESRGITGQVLVVDGGWSVTGE